MASECPIHYVLVDVKGLYLEETKVEFERIYNKVKEKSNLSSSEWFFSTCIMTDPNDLLNVSNIDIGGIFF